MKHIGFAVFLVFLIPLSLFAAKDPADYPLEVHILGTHWKSEGRGFYSGWGRGNIKDGQSLHGIEFNYFDCVLLKTTIGEGQGYPGRWKKNKLQLEILVSEIGKVEKFQSCDLKTTVSDNVYLHGPGGLISVTQQQYMDWLARRDTQRVRQQLMPTSDGTVTTPPSRTPTASVSITSTPIGAEIEVDGALMGNTPSTLDLVTGEHKVTVRKNSYKAWERNVKVVGGTVNLNAELEPDASR